MDYANENWIKVYTRDTASWLAKSLAARGLALELARHMEKASGEISLGSRGLRAVAALLRAAWEDVEAPLRELLDEGDLEYDGERQVLRDPEHPARQGAVASPALRKRQQRERETPRDEPSRDVTRGHAESPKKESETEEKESETRAREDVREPESENTLGALMPPWAEAQVEALAASNLIDATELDPPLIWAKYEAKRAAEKRPLSEPDFRGFVCTWISNWKDRRTRDRAELAARKADEERRDRASPARAPVPVTKRVLTAEAADALCAETLAVLGAT